MKCSQCSAQVRPVVALDIDGTLGDYHGHFLDFATAYLGHGITGNIDIYNGSIPHRQWFCEAYQVDVTKFREVKLAYRQGGMKRSMPVYRHAAELTRALRLAGAEVWITTTRPWERFDRVDPDTREWLRRNRIDFDGLIYDEDKYEVLARRVEPQRVVAVLDDLPEALSAASRAFGAGATLLRRTSWNAGVSWSVSVSDLATAEAVIKSHLADWVIRYQFDDLSPEDLIR